MVFGRISSVSILILLIMASIIIMPNTTEKVSAQLHYGVTVESLPDERPGDSTAKVGPGEAAFARLRFKVTNTGLANIFESITMSTVYGAGTQSVTISPSMFTLSRSKSLTVMAYITVDRNSEAPRNIPVEVTARIVNDPTSKAGSASGVVIVNQFSFLVIDPGADAYKEIPPGTKFIDTFKILNQGNGVDPVRFEVTNKDELEKEGWSITIPPSQQIQMQKYIAVSLSGTTPRMWGWKSEFRTITFKVISDLRDTQTGVRVNYSQEYPVTVFLRGFFVPAFDPAFTIMAISMVAAGLYSRGNKKPEIDATTDGTPKSDDNAVNVENKETTDTFNICAQNDCDRNRS
ncbi:MAG: choice-of-anchor T family protein [Thermoplasmata archaeon]